MALSIEKMAPTLVGAGVVVWCCWPFLEGPGLGLGETSSGNLPEISAEQLAPDVPLVCGRDPFQPVDTTQTPGRIEVPETTETAAMPEEPMLGQTGVPVVPIADGPSAELECKRIARSAMLRATFIQGDRRVALINDKLCVEGQKLPVAGLTRGAGTVREIRPNEVIIEYRGRTVALKYPDLAGIAKQQSNMGTTP